MRRNWWVKILTIAVVLAGTSTFLNGCGKAARQTNHQIKVVASTDFYGEVAKAVLGNKGQVTAVITQPSVDPHDYEPTPKVAKQVHEADVTVANGVGYDSWMTKLTKDTQAVNIEVGEDLMKKQNGDNPHLWYQPATMPKLAKALAARYGKLQPQNKAYFNKQADKYIQSLQPIQTELATIKRLAAKQKQHMVYVSEPVFDYALAATGFKVANPDFERAVENESDPSPKSIARMQAGLKHRQVAFFVVNQQVDSPTINHLAALAKQNHVPVLRVTETLPAGMTYKTWMLSQYRALAKILA